MNIQTYKLAITTMATIGWLQTSPAVASPVESEAIYFGIGLSQSTISQNQQNVAARIPGGDQLDFEADGFGIKLTAGVELDKHLGMEIQYSDIGSIAVTDGTITEQLYEAESLIINTVLRQTVSKNVNVFGKLGASLWRLTDDNSEDIDDGNGLFYGAGFDINVYGNKDRTLRVEWEHHEFNNIILDSVDTVSLSLMFNIR